MTEAVSADWEQAFAAWLAPFLAALGHKVRRRWAPVYVRGLLGERKSVQPMAARVAPQDNDQLHHFISSPAWPTAPLEAVLAREADRLVGGPEAVLIIDCRRRACTRSVSPANTAARWARQRTANRWSR